MIDTSRNNVCPLYCNCVARIQVVIGLHNTPSLTKEKTLHILLKGIHLQLNMLTYVFAHKYLKEGIH